MAAAARALIRCKVIRPFAFCGRYASSGERLALHPSDFERLRDSGHVTELQPAEETLPAGEMG